MNNFILNAFHHLKNTGAICPSSRKLVKTIIEAAQLEDKKHIVELGPGTGVITKAIIENKQPNATYFGLDINEAFIENISDTLSGAVIYHDSAEAIQKYLNINGIEKTDCIISSLPWANFKPPFQKKLLETLYENLSENGLLITYAYNLGLYFAKGKEFKTALSEKFSSVETSKTIWTNIPSAFVYKAKK